jgi:hypothetical protein
MAVGRVAHAIAGRLELPRQQAAKLNLIFDNQNARHSPGRPISAGPPRDSLAARHAGGELNPGRTEVLGSLERNLLAQATPTSFGVHVVGEGHVAESALRFLEDDGLSG